MAKSAKIVPFRPAAFRPIVIRSTKVVKSKRKHHRHHGGRGVGGIFNRDRIGIAGGALALGFLQKSGMAAQLPKIPLLGEAGTIGVIAALFGGKLGNQIADAAFAVAAYEFGATGQIVGEGDVQPGGYVGGI